MTTASLFAYALALLLAVATPGPAMFAVISTGVARGTRPAVAVGLGVAAGDVLLTGLALLGLVALAATFGWVFAVVKYGGAAYLIWLGIKMWRAVPEMVEGRTTGSNDLFRSFGLGATVALGNPKAILFHASLMPLLLDMSAMSASDAVVVLAVVFAINLVTMSTYAALSGGASRWFQTPARLRWMNRVGGGAMVGTGAVIASR